ncbi:hypothetical protein AB0N17_43165 [Streptomyces sp. NPDC051133]|uniref:hypothetical protein n=1 Tax=Streptomyces sp. NPDC051133 TaxID=3155521 RepID=UPI003428D8DF
MTLRTPIAQGTVTLHIATSGFDPASLGVQRYDTSLRRWIDADSADPGSGADRTFPLSGGGASSGHPVSVPLRIKDLDRPGHLTVTATVDDRHGHTYRAVPQSTVADRPTSAVGPWPHNAALVRGGKAKELTLTVRNTTGRAYPSLYASFIADGENGHRVLKPKDLTLQQYVHGRGWERIALKAGSCDPGMGSRLFPVADSPLRPGATAVYRLRFAVNSSAAVSTAQAGVVVATGNTDIFFQQLPFTIRNR